MTYTVDRSKMKDSRGSYRTKTLFVELSDVTHFGDGTPCVPVYTLDEVDQGPYYSFKKMYLDIGDPTEYKQAELMLGSTDHWEKLISSKDPSIVSLIKSCRKALAMKLESMAFAAILDEGLSSDKAAVRVTAFKQVLSEAKELNEDKSKRKVGRPAKNPLGKDDKELNEEEKNLIKDLQRINEGLNGNC